LNGAKTQMVRARREATHAVYLGMDFFNYTNHVLSFMLRYRF